MPNFGPLPLKHVRNVFGSPLAACSTDPLTGYVRDGYCRRVPGDHGEHVVCAVMSDAFLAFSAARGNELSSPNPECNFPGLKAGDCWCLCLQRWLEARAAGAAPKLKLEATHENVLEWVDLNILKAYQI